MKSMLKSLMSVAAAALAFTSCSNDTTEDVMPNGGSKTLQVNATIDQTRTVMADDHIHLDWATGDQIHLYIGASATEAHSINPETGGKITGVTYEDGKTVVYAYYSLPYDGEESTGAKNALININQKQTQTDASIFAGQNLPMVAKGTITGGQVNLVFQPVGCVLVFNVYGQGKTGEKVKSIKFETSKGCYGYDYCDLTAENLVYQAYSGGKNATVTLTNPATIGASKPSDTKVGENQIYLVVAQAEYPAGSKFTVTTDATENNTYTFTTTSALDCSTTTARVVNLNLSKSTELKPSIEVPTVNEQPATEVPELVISPITFKNIALDANVDVNVYSDEALTAPIVEADSWIKFTNTASIVGDKALKCHIAANEKTDPRTAYIVIECGDVKSPAIVVKQVGSNSTPAVPTIVFEEDFKALTDGNNTETSGQPAWTDYKPKFSAATNVYDAGGAIKLGKSDKSGSITTKKLDLSGPITLEFKVKGWNNKIEGHIKILVDGVEKETFVYKAEMADAFEQASVQLEAATEESTITIATSAKRAFIDDIVIKVTK